MILQYFKSKENEYKKTANEIYINILKKSKILANGVFFKEKDFDSSFELITIILIFYLYSFKQENNDKNKKISEEIMNNFINDLDQSMREIGIGDMSIGKSVKKYVNKFYFRVKKIDIILNDFKPYKLEGYLHSLKNIDKLRVSNLVSEFVDIHNDIKNTFSAKY